mgnify:FL=1|tara:strand:- start:677 stop:1078 length:402 start_codon:yes stop_codon:yes gene_type:complete
MCEKPVIRVAVAIIRDEGKFIIARRDEKGRLASQWELPGGSVHEGVSLEEGLKDHLAKRFNLDVVVGDKLGTSNYDYDFGNVQLTAFYVECISKKLKLSQHLAYRWIRLNMLKDFEIVHSAMPIIELLKQQMN